MTKSHIVPGLAHAYLISTRKFYNAGFQVAFDMDEFRVYYKNKLVLTGVFDPVTELWRLPTNPTAVRPAQSTVDRLGLKLMPHQTVLHVANNVHMIMYIQNQLKHMYQRIFFPPIATLIKAVENYFLEGLPFMISKLVRKYLKNIQKQQKEGRRPPPQGY